MQDDVTILLRIVAKSVKTVFEDEIQRQIQRANQGEGR